VIAGETFDATENRHGVEMGFGDDFGLKTPVNHWLSQSDVREYSSVNGPVFRKGQTRRVRWNHHQVIAASGGRTARRYSRVGDQTIPH